MKHARKLRKPAEGFTRRWTAEIAAGGGRDDGRVRAAESLMSEREELPKPTPKVVMQGR